MTGAELRERRQRLGLSQEALARALTPYLGRTVSMNTIARWERNERRPFYVDVVERALTCLEQAPSNPPRLGLAR